MSSNCGTVKLLNTKVYPFNNSETTVRLTAPAESTDYIVSCEVLDAEGEWGDVIVSGKARNGFKIAFTGSARWAEIRWTAETRLTATVEKSRERHIEFCRNGNIISFDGGTLIIDLEKEQRGGETVVDISLDRDGVAVVGVSDWYAAQIRIPPRKFEVRENGITDAMGFRQIEKRRLPLNTEEVTLTLWAMEEKNGTL